MNSANLYNPSHKGISHDYIIDELLIKLKSTSQIDVWYPDD